MLFPLLDMLFPYCPHGKPVSEFKVHIKGFALSLSHPTEKCSVHLICHELSC